jgi:hypothetical protein
MEKWGYLLTQDRYKSRFFHKSLADDSSGQGAKDLRRHWGPKSKSLALMVICILLSACRSSGEAVRPSIEFSKLPPLSEGGPDKLDTIEGRVNGARPGQRIVLFAKGGIWWVQPFVDNPFTMIQPDSTWKSPTHLGTGYAALLVEPGYVPPATMDALPTEGHGVVAIAVTKVEDPVAPKTIQFSGYEWTVRNTSSNRGGSSNPYDPTNAWTDENGFLHLRIAGEPGKRTCAEVSLTRSLGYGSYIFVVHDTSHLEPAAVLSMFTWDDEAADQNHRELDIEITRWGDPGSKNAQYVVQPYYLPTNVARFIAPPGVLTHSFRWEPGKVTFKTFPGKNGSAPGGKSRDVAEQIFSTGVPSPGAESVHLTLFVYGNTKNPLQKNAEVVIEKFEYLP